MQELAVFLFTKVISLSGLTFLIIITNSLSNEISILLSSYFSVFLSDGNVHVTKVQHCQNLFEGKIYIYMQVTMNTVRKLIVTLTERDRVFFEGM